MATGLGSGAPSARAAADEPTVVGGRNTGQAHTFTEDSDSFDDFAAVRDVPGHAPFPDADDGHLDDLDDIAERLGWGDDTEPAHDTSSKLKQVNKNYLVAGAGVVVVLIAVALIMLLQADPPELATTPRAPATATATAPAARVDLKEPELRGTTVVLTWTSNPEVLDFVVFVTRPNGPPQTIRAYRNHTATVTVEEAGGYCFQIEATNSQATDRQVYLSQTQSIRGDDCRR